MCVHFSISVCVCVFTLCCAICVCVADESVWEAPKSSAWRRRFSKHENLTYQALKQARQAGRLNMHLVVMVLGLCIDVALSLRGGIGVQGRGGFMNNRIVDCERRPRIKTKRWSGEQVELAQRRQLEAFKSSIPSLQVAASFACSVASLSRSPAFQLPGHHHLHGEVLADHQFDWGGLSTCTAAHAQCLLTPSPSQNLQESPPSTHSGFGKQGRCTCKGQSSSSSSLLLIIFDGRIYGVQVSLLWHRLVSCIDWCVAVSLHICS